VTASVPEASQGVPYSDQLQATGGLAPYRWKKSGTYPKGLRLTSAGLLSGAIGSRVAAGTYSIGVSVSDTAKPTDTASATLSLEVVGTPGAPTSAGALGLNHALLVSWQAPVSDGGSPVTGYVVRLSGTAEGCSTTELSCLINGLKNIARPHVNVRAENSVGLGTSVRFVAHTSRAPNCAYLYIDANLQGCDLAGVNLSGVDLADAILTDASSGGITGTPSALPSGWILTGGYLAGPGADLADATLSHTNLTGADLTGASLAGVISGVITGTPLALPAGWLLVSGYLVGPGANLTNANLTKFDLTGADLTGASLTAAKLARANLDDVTSGGITGTPSALPKGWILEDGYLIGPEANLAKVNLTGFNLTNVNLTGTDLSHAILTGSELIGANFTNANLTDVDLSNFDLSGVNLTGANLDYVISGGITGTPVALPAEWSLIGGYLVGPDSELENADLNGLDLSGTTLTGVASGGITGTPSALPTDWTLIGGFLIGPGDGLDLANLTGLNLTGVDLVAATMDYANLTDANLTDADLSGATLVGAIWSSTTCPDGTNSNSDGDTCVSNLG
jgi:uncharacterized protein YjbI with pentapeptide repeats